jgi:murein L,D-transpeptidase YcbB/YkuD
MELNPYWHIPPKIAKKDILQHVLENPNYLFEQNIRIFQNWKANAQEIDPKSVDWSHITANNFSFKLRQDPGPSNALGRVKFIFPNKFDVYLHDTPARALFKKTKRSSSSGCIRVEKPIELAAYLLKSDPKWTYERILTAINRGRTRIVRVPQPISVHVLYLTAWADEDATVHFRNDFYGRDEPLYKVFDVRSPSSPIANLSRIAKEGNL